MFMNKKVPLRERKRHTARRVVSTPSVVLPGYPPRGGTWTPRGYPVRYPPQGSGTRTPQGYPVRYTPQGGTQTPPGGYQSGTPQGTRSGTPQGGTQSGPPGGVPGPPRGEPVRYPPGGVPGPPPLPHGILGNVAKHYGIWVPPPVDRQIDGWTDACQNITFPRTTYAGGNETKKEETHNCTQLPNILFLNVCLE